MADKNYLHTAYANSADGTDGFTTVYPNLNLLDGTMGFNGAWEVGSSVTSDGFKGNLLVKSQSSSGVGIFKRYIATKDGDYTFSTWVSATAGQSPSIIIGKNRVQQASVALPNTAFDWFRVTYTLKNVKSGDEITGRIDKFGDVFGKVSVAGHKWEYGSVATPYIPSASEVTTADYPKYVGTYVDTNPTSSTDSSKYDWDDMKYRVYLDGVPVGGSQLLSFDLENLKAGTSYNVQVNQINGNDESDKSESVAFKTTLTK